METKLNQNDYRMLVHLVDKQFPLDIETYVNPQKDGWPLIISKTTPVQLEGIWIEEKNIAIWENFFGYDSRKNVKSLSDFKFHITKFKVGTKFANLSELCSQISINHSDGDSQQAYDSTGAQMNIDSQYRIINPIQHHSRYQGPKDVSIVGYFAVRPILSNGEVVTSDVIEKYIGNKNGN